MQLQPIRKIRPSNRSVTGKHSSKKTCSVHYFESSLERDFLILLEWDDNVVDFIAQPMTINYTYEEQQRRYTPDVIVYYESQLKRQPLLCEIKYSEELHNKADELKCKFDAANQYCLLNGFQFKILTEKEIRTDRLSNIKFLSSYLNALDNDKCIAFIYSQIDEQGCVTPKQLVDQLCSKGVDSALGLSTLWKLVAHGKLGVDMEPKITMNSRVWKL